MITKITTVQELKSYILAHHIDLQKFKDKNDNEGTNRIEDPLKNPLLWNHLISDQLYPAIDFLLDYQSDWLTVNIAVALLQSRNNHGLTKDRVEKIMEILSSRNVSDIDMVLLSLITDDKLKVLTIVFKYMKEKNISLNENGAFIRGGISEAAKIGDMRLVELIKEYYPDCIKKAEHWPYLNALKHGHYRMALYFIHNGCNKHAIHDLGYKLLRRNYDKKLMPVTKEEIDAYNTIMDLYHIEQNSKVG